MGDHCCGNEVVFWIIKEDKQADKNLEERISSRDGKRLLDILHTSNNADTLKENCTPKS